MKLKFDDGGDFEPHPEGIHPAVCVDVIDLGMTVTKFQGEERIVLNVMFVFETEQWMENGRKRTIWKIFPASPHPKASLAGILGKWFGRQIIEGDTIDLDDLIGRSCTLVISHYNFAGRIYASIDDISRPTKELTPSAYYDAAAVRQRIFKWKTKQAANPAAALRLAPPLTSLARKPKKSRAGFGAVRNGGNELCVFDPNDIVP